MPDSHFASDKIKNLPEISKIVRKLKKQGKRIVHCHGVFDLLHPGHIKHLNSAKRNGDVLVVTLTADKHVKKGPGRPYFNEDMRAEVLANLAGVDYVAVVDADSAIVPIKKIKPDFYVKGPDYKTRKHFSSIPRKLGDEEAAVRAVGGQLIYTDDVVFSSSTLINTFFDSYPPDTKEYLDRLKKKYTPDAIVEYLLQLQKLKVLVIGDAIIDEYHYCVPMGKSSKEPIIVHRYMSEETFIGGALATVNHTASLVKSVDIFSMLGSQRSFERFIRKRLKSTVTPTFFYNPGASTVIKRRFIDNSIKQKLFQVSYIKDGIIGEKVEERIYSHLKERVEKYDLVIVNDFGHGMLTERIVRLLCNKSKFLALNVQANSANYGFNTVTKYPSADFVCIDEQEIRLATHDRYSDVRVLIKKIYKEMKAKEMLVTKGPEGSISYDADDDYLITPALTTRVVDRVGAGDALFAISAPCVAAGLPRDVASFVGNVAGAMQVQVVGNKNAVEFGDLVKFITRLLK